MTPGKKKIGTLLIVDDCERMRQEIRLTVDDLVAEIIEAADGQAAVNAYVLYKPDWVTMDITMTPVDGLVAAKRIKSEHPSALIVFLTHHDTRAFRQAARLAGATAYIRKDNIESLRDFLTQPLAPKE